MFEHWTLGLCNVYTSVHAKGALASTLHPWLFVNTSREVTLKAVLSVPTSIAPLSVFLEGDVCVYVCVCWGGGGVLVGQWDICCTSILVTFIMSISFLVFLELAVPERRN